MQEFDIAIIGGGLVGASFARAIADLGLHTVIIDRSPAPQRLFNTDERGLALSYTSKTSLAHMGVWSQLEPYAYPMQTIHISEQGSFGFTKISAAQYNLPALGFVVGAQQLSATICGGLTQTPTLKILRPVTLSNLQFVSQRWLLNILQDGQAFEFSAKLLVAADGANSKLHAMQNIPVFTHDYQQSALVTNVTTSNRISPVAFERFTSSGVLALLPFGAKRLKCVLTMSNTALDAVPSDSATIIEYLHKLIGYRAGRFIAADNWHKYPLLQQQAKRIIDHQAVLLGNAANTMHPVAAQGFNLGLRDAMCLAKCLRIALQQRKPYYSDEVLHEYAQQRNKDHESTNKFTHLLSEIFVGQNLMMRHARGLGLLAANFVPQINRKIAKQGLGAWVY